MLYIPSPHACEFLFTLNNLLCLSEFSMWYVLLLLLLDASPLPDLYVDSFHLSILKHLISWNITISQVFLTILRFSFCYFYICICELLQCVLFVHCCAVGLLLCLLYSARVFYCMCNEIRRDKIFRRTSNSTNTLERVSIIFTTCGDRV